MLSDEAAKVEYNGLLLGRLGAQPTMVATLILAHDLAGEQQMLRVEPRVELALEEREESERRVRVPLSLDALDLVS